MKPVAAIMIRIPALIGGVARVVALYSPLGFLALFRSRRIAAAVSYRLFERTNDPSSSVTKNLL